MKLYAHRGWAMGPGENSLDAFARPDSNEHVDGVEFDVRRSRDGRLVVIHDPIRPDDNPPSLDAVLEQLKPGTLRLLLEIKEPGIAQETIKAVCACGLEDRAIVFGFPGAADTFPWDEPRAVKLGLIAHLPWQADRLVARHRPDVFMLGWDRRIWTRIAFRLWWSCFSLRRFGERNNLPIVAGIVRHRQDLDWLKRQNISIAVADFDQIESARPERTP